MNNIPFLGPTAPTSSSIDHGKTRVNVGRPAPNPSQPTQLSPDTTAAVAGVKATQIGRARANASASSTSAHAAASSTAAAAASPAAASPGSRTQSKNTPLNHHPILVKARQQRSPSAQSEHLPVGQAMTVHGSQGFHNGTQAVILATGPGRYQQNKEGWKQTYREILTQVSQEACESKDTFTVSLPFFAVAMGDKEAAAALKEVLTEKSLPPNLHIQLVCHEKHANYDALRETLTPRTPLLRTPVIDHLTIVAGDITTLPAHAVVIPTSPKLDYQTMGTTGQAIFASLQKNHIAHLKETLETRIQAYAGPRGQKIPDYSGLHSILGSKPPRGGQKNIFSHITELSEIDPRSLSENDLLLLSVVAERLETVIPAFTAWAADKDWEEIGPIWQEIAAASLRKGSPIEVALDVVEVIEHAFLLPGRCPDTTRAQGAEVYARLVNSFVEGTPEFYKASALAALHEAHDPKQSTLDTQKALEAAHLFALAGDHKSAIDIYYQVSSHPDLPSDFKERLNNSVEIYAQQIITKKDYGEIRALLKKAVSQEGKVLPLEEKVIKELLDALADSPSIEDLRDAHNEYRVRYPTDVQQFLDQKVASLRRRKEFTKAADVLLISKNFEGAFRVLNEGMKGDNPLLVAECSHKFSNIIQSYSQLRSVPPAEVNTEIAYKKYYDHALQELQELRTKKSSNYNQKVDEFLDNLTKLGHAEEANKQHQRLKRK